MFEGSDHDMNRVKDEKQNPGLRVKMDQDISIKTYALHCRPKDHQFI